MPPQLFRRIRALSPKDEDEGAFDDYKVIMEGIKREHPDLPPSVQQQMAVERFSSLKERRTSQNQSNLITAMSNFRFGRGNKAATGDPTTNSNDTNEPEDRRRSLNPRTSVARINTKGLSQSILEIPSDEDNSLEDSLLNIEASAAPRKQASRRVSRRDSQKHASLTRSSTELLNVKEDEELLNASIPESLANSKDRTQRSDQDSKSTKKSCADPHRSISGDLPDEIKVALGEYDIDDGQRSLGSHDKSEGRRRSRVHESMRSSNASSFLSIDSANFEGDFSAWGSKTA